MLTEAHVEHLPSGWHVAVRTGPHIELHGPYRWLWFARFVAWFNDGVH